MSMTADELAVTVDSLSRYIAEAMDSLGLPSTAEPGELVAAVRGLKAEVDRLRAENARLWYDQPREPFTVEEPDRERFDPRSLRPPSGDNPIHG